MKPLTLALWLAMGAALLPPHGIAKADFEAGVRAYDLGDAAAAVAEFRPLAEAGDVAAAYNLGVIYSRGEVGEVDLEAAARWFRVAAESGASAAQNRLGTMYFRGRGVPQDTETAAMWIRRAAEQGDPNAQTNLARMYLTGAGVPKDFAESERWAKLANARGQGDRRVRPGIVRGPLAVTADEAAGSMMAKVAPSAGAPPPPPGAVTAPVLAVSSAPPPPPPPPPTVVAPSIGEAPPPPPVRKSTVTAAPALPPPPPAMAETTGDGASRADVAATAPRDAAAESAYMVQLISLRTETDAKAAWRQFGRAHAAVLDGLPHRVERADLGRRGVFYRLRVGPFEDQAAAAKLCRDLTARRVACWIALQ